MTLLREKGENAAAGRHAAAAEQECAPPPLHPGPPSERSGWSPGSLHGHHSPPGTTSLLLPQD